MRARFLILGRNGQVGWELRRTLAPLGEVVAVDYPEIDLTLPDSIVSLLRQARPTVVINAAAYTAVDKAESEPEKCHQINGVAPGIIAEETARLGARVVHYSTDYVFDGNRPAEHPYVETDEPNPLSVYGRTKLAGDIAVRQANPAHLIFRLCWVYGARGQNFLLTMRRLAQERELLRVVHDQFGSPTWSRMIAEATALALQQAGRDDNPSAYTGTYHLAASGHTSWHGFAEAIISSVPAAVRKCRTVEPIPTESYPLPARRPASAVLCCDKLEKTFGLRLPDWRTSLQDVLESF